MNSGIKRTGGALQRVTNSTSERNALWISIQR
jgi:hypothetical protein